MLPPAERPEHTEGYEGFYHLAAMSGSVEEASIEYIIRDHDRARFEARKHFMESAVALLNERHGEGVVELTLKDQYYNMKRWWNPIRN